MQRNLVSKKIFITRGKTIYFSNFCKICGSIADTSGLKITTPWFYLMVNTCNVKKQMKPLTSLCHCCRLSQPHKREWSRLYSLPPCWRNLVSMRMECDEYVTQEHQFEQREPSLPLKICHTQCAVVKDAFNVFRHKLSSLRVRFYDLT